MGKYLDAWLQTELPKLMLSRPVQHEPATQHPSGAMTFPAPDAPRLAPGTMMGSGNVGTFGRGPTAPPMGGMPEFGKLVNETPEQRSPQYDERGFPANAASTFEPPKRPRQSAVKSIDDVESFDDLASLDPDTVKHGTDVLEQQLGGPKGLNKAYQQATGRAPPKGMSREEKGQLLMEFGLRVLAHNNGNTSLEAIGQAGVETLGSYRQMQAGKVKAEVEAEERKAKNEKADLERRVMEAQLARSDRAATEVKADRDGNLRLINKEDGTSRMVVDEQGNPVKTGGEGSDEFVFNLQKQAFEGAFCEGLSGDALKACQQNALLFSKGGSIAELAFPEVRRQRQVDSLMRFYADPDNASVQLRTKDGTMKRWREMTGDEQRDAILRYVDQFDTGLSGKATGPRSATPSADNGFGLTAEQQAQIPENKRVKISTGVYIARRNGKLVKVDEAGNPLE